MKAPLLPEGFAALEPFVADWAIAGTGARAARRIASQADAREAFFAAASPLLDEALGYLDRHPVEALGGPEKRLMDLMLMLAHIALAVEIQGRDEDEASPGRARLAITRATADRDMPG